MTHFATFLRHETAVLIARRMMTYAEITMLMHAAAPVPPYIMRDIFKDRVVLPRTSISAAPRIDIRRAASARRDDAHLPRDAGAPITGFHRAPHYLYRPTRLDVERKRVDK